MRPFLRFSHCARDALWVPVHLSARRDRYVDFEGGRTG